MIVDAECFLRSPMLASLRISDSLADFRQGLVGNSQAAQSGHRDNAQMTFESELACEERVVIASRQWKAQRIERDRIVEAIVGDGEPLRIIKDTQHTSALCC